jgi:lipopolysaccharide export system permease protein
MQFLWKYIDDLVGKGLQWYVITQLLFYASSTFIPLALPLSVLLSSLMTFGNFGERYELVAMKSAGISLRNTMKSLVFTAIIISVGAFYFSNDVLPVANLKMRALLYDVREQKPAVSIIEGVFYNGIENYVIRVGSKEKDGKTINNVIIFDHTDRMGNNNMTLAERGTMEFTDDKRFLIFHLFNGTNYLEDLSSRKKEESRPLQRTTFKEQYVRIDLSEFALTRTKEEFFKGNYSMLNLHQLNIVYDSLSKNLNKNKERFSKKFTKDFLFYYNAELTKKQNITDNAQQTANIKLQSENKIVKDLTEKKKLKENIIDNFDKMEKTGIIETAIEIARRAKENIFFENMDDINRVKIINRHLVEYHRKFTLSLACLICFLIGAPLGAIIRRGGFGLPVVVSVLFFLFYHVISIIGEKAAKESIFPVYIGMWISTIVMLPIGLIIAYKAITDSPILDAEKWTRFFKKLYLIRKEKKEESSE